MIAKDYFQDITPPAGGTPTPPSPRPAAPAPAQSREPEMHEYEAEESSEKSIRNIQITPTARRPRFDEGAPPRNAAPPQAPKKSSRMFLWVGLVASLAVIGALALVALRPTTVTVTPRSHTVLFDEMARFTAYPAESAATGTLAFTLETDAIEDSQIVPAQGTERVQDKAQGTITIYNDHSTTPLKLIKNTRFQTPAGLVFRTPNEINVPGKRGTTPGQLTVTVIADKAGEEYNIGPVERFTLPGLQGSPEYSKVHASSNAPMTGGFVGDRPAASESAVQAARAEIRGRLLERARSLVGEKSSETKLAFFDLTSISYESLPSVPEGDSNLRIHERARIEIPVFPADDFAYLVGQSVSAEAASGDMMLVPGEGFGAQREGSSTSTPSSIPFTLQGSAQLVWKIDVGALAEALAGREENAFQAIVATFPGIEEARARIEPFWQKSFPTDASKIKVKVEEPSLNP